MGVKRNPNYFAGIKAGQELVKTYGKENAKKEWLPFFKKSLKTDKGFYLRTQGSIAWEFNKKPYLQGKVRGIREALKRR